MATDLFVSWLLSQVRYYQDRAGLPTLADIRAHGVTRREIREYLRATGWYCDAMDTGDCGTRGQWQDGPPTWSHDDYSGSLDLRNDDLTIRDLALCECRSPWAVLASISALGDAREIYYDDQLVATVKGSTVLRAADGALFDL